MPEKTVVVGAGDISNAWLPLLKRERVEVLAVVDTCIENARGQIAKYRLGAEASTKLRATLRRQSPDFVLNLTPPEAHYRVTCEALRAGCHVMSEKPLASSMTQARKMVLAAEEAQRLIMVSQSRRWQPHHEAVRRSLRAGQVGELTTVDCDFYVGAHFGGFRDAMRSPLLLDMAIHHFDLARYLTGKEPLTVYAKEYNPRGSWFEGCAAAACVFELSDGVVFTYRGSLCAEGRHTSWNGDWRFVGTRGVIVRQGDRRSRGQQVDGGGAFYSRMKPLDMPAIPLRHTGMHAALRQMLGFLRGGRRPQTDCRDNIKSLAMVCAAVESARKDRPVPVTVL